MIEADKILVEVVKGYDVLLQYAAPEAPVVGDIVSSGGKDWVVRRRNWVVMPGNHFQLGVILTVKDVPKRKKHVRTN